jgi:hypothetical protein
MLTVFKSDKHFLLRVKIKASELVSVFIFFWRLFFEFELYIYILAQLFIQSVAFCYFYLIHTSMRMYISICNI